ncbi:YktB family protein [Jeotgalibacillus haloalkalitolerans]|uniref:UPF0637 protein UFB30_11695 n=1 Tax=Jeotgalibacillus haloalkalitolerans TaxID=3104292 RepID=A0ABU5KQB1_9BACL|nr:DUF1054 domain-containing protein [Jeotgalibacillus sp. HH7-29]MDZ5712890.1 DUF1054 domain-containing protein [Jeotgalibacillus sp. HH7-29]
MTGYFSTKDFEVFNIDGLDERMESIRSRIQPKFQELGDLTVPALSEQTGEEMHLHIARHARRSVNPPNDTWMAAAPSKRGYKKMPHFQFGLWGDHLFIWTAFIYELPEKENIAKTMIENFDDLMKVLPEDGYISADHMKKEAKKISEMNEGDILHVLERFEKVKKAEFLAGRRIEASEAIKMSKDELSELILQTWTELLPLYKLGTRVQQAV